MEELILRYRNLYNFINSIEEIEAGNVSEETEKELDAIYSEIVKIYRSSANKEEILMLLIKEYNLLSGIVTTEEEIDLLLKLGVDQRAFLIHLFEKTHLQFYLIEHSKTLSPHTVASYITILFNEEEWDWKYMFRLNRLHPEAFRQNSLIRKAIEIYPRFDSPLKFLSQIMTVEELRDNLFPPEKTHFYCSLSYLPGFEYLLTFPQFYLSDNFLNSLFFDGCEKIKDLLKADNAKRGPARVRMTELNKSLESANKILVELSLVLREAEGLTAISLSFVFDELKLDILRQIVEYDRLAQSHDFAYLNLLKCDWRLFDYELAYRKEKLSR